jgi:hypothetical protein
VRSRFGSPAARKLYSFGETLLNVSTSDTANALLVMRAPSVTAWPFLIEVRHEYLY